MSMIARTANALKSACANSTLSLQRRHGSGGVNAWEKPTDPASWKGEHTVIVVLSGWAMVIYGATQAFGKKKPVAAAEAPAAPAAPAAPTAEKVVAKAEAVATEVKETASKATSTAIDSVQKSIDAVAGEGK